jgi:hypothetical protein
MLVSVLPAHISVEMNYIRPLWTYCGKFRITLSIQSVLPAAVLKPKKVNSFAKNYN